MAEPKEHISVCVCTFKRPDLLAQLLKKLGRQATGGKFDFSAVVVDNDAGESARATVESHREGAGVPVEYCVEPEQNIALARNLAVARARGELVAFIDDDEFPAEGWLAGLYSMLGRSQADGVLGPVIPSYEVPPPRWVVKSRWFERPTHPTGQVLEWPQTRTGNVLLRREVFRDVEGPFRRECGDGGEDRDFFRRVIAKGRRFVWCQEAAVYEVVPAHRLRRSFQVRRALVRGRSSLARSRFGAVDVMKSVGASLLYTAALPCLLLLGQHVFMRYLIKDFDHIGRLLAACGINPVKERYLS